MKLRFGFARRGHQRETSAAGEGGATELTGDAYRTVPILAQPTWGAEIAAYFFFGGISSGAGALGALALLAGGPRRRRFGRVAQCVALGALLPCPPLLIADLGRPQRFHHMLRIFKPSSPMNLGAWTLLAHGALTTAAAGLALGRAADVLPAPLRGLLPEKALAAASLAPALTLGGYTGVLLGTTSVPVWSISPLLGGLFMASSLSTGLAATGLAAMLVPGDVPAALERANARLDAAIGAAELALLGGYVAGSGRSAQALLRGRPGLLLAGAAAATAVGVALDLLSAQPARRMPGLAVFAHGLNLLGGALLRTAVVQAGKASAADREATLAATQPSRRAPGWGPRPPV